MGKRAVKSGCILSSLPPVYPPYKSWVKKSHPVPEQTHPRFAPTHTLVGANLRVRPVRSFEMIYQKIYRSTNNENQYINDSRYDF